jgi:hypothetical protein
MVRANPVSMSLPAAATRFQKQPLLQRSLKGLNGVATAAGAGDATPLELGIIGMFRGDR